MVMSISREEVPQNIFQVKCMSKTQVKSYITMFIVFLDKYTRYFLMSFLSVV